jgi:hypothetical protein
MYLAFPSTVLLQAGYIRDRIGSGSRYLECIDIVCSAVQQ